MFAFGIVYDWICFALVRFDLGGVGAIWVHGASNGSTCVQMFVSVS